MNLDCGRCEVRDWRVSDKASLVPLANNRKVWRNLAHRFPHPYTEASADFWFALLAKQSPLTHWAIDIDGAAVGGIGIDPGEGIYAKTAVFGYWLGEPHWGQGIMTEAVKGLLEAAFATGFYPVVRARALQSNAASIHVLEKAGFRNIGAAIDPLGTNRGQPIFNFRLERPR